MDQFESRRAGHDMKNAQFRTDVKWKAEGLYGQGVVRGEETPEQNDNNEQVRVGGGGAGGQKLTEEKWTYRGHWRKTEHKKLLKLTHKTQILTKK